MSYLKQLLIENETKLQAMRVRREAAVNDADMPVHLVTAIEFEIARLESAIRTIQRDLKA
jgi:hypothetical protein